MRLTPVREEAKIPGKVPGKTSYAARYDDYLPIVDKPVDAGSNKQLSIERSYSSKGKLQPPGARRTPEVVQGRFWTMLMAFFTMFVTTFRSFAASMTKKLPDASSSSELAIPDAILDTVTESRPPSPLPAFTEADLLSNMLKRLGELEEKVDTLQSKPSEMPYEKVELLNAAVYRVDALEAELIATKKALHEALMRQEELLAYIDRQQDAKYRKKKFCW